MEDGEEFVIPTADNPIVNEDIDFRRKYFMRVISEPNRLRVIPSDNGKGLTFLFEFAEGSGRYEAIRTLKRGQLAALTIPFSKFNETDLWQTMFDQYLQGPPKPPKPAPTLLRPHEIQEAN